MPRSCLLACAILFHCLCTPHLAKAWQSDFDLERLLRQSPDTILRHVLDHPERYEAQIIYTRIDRDADNTPHFTTWRLGVDDTRYFYPASTVKMPTAFMALEKLRQLDIQGLDPDDPMLTLAGKAPQTATLADTTSPTGLPSLAHYIRKIFLVSDNEAQNRLYEFVGQRALNEGLWQKGYEHTRIVHRLGPGGFPFGFEDNRYTNPVQFLDAETGQLRYYQGLVYSDGWPAHLMLRGTLRGRAHMADGKLIPQPFNFSRKNFISLQDLHDMLQAVMFPEAVPAARRFHLTEADYAFLWKAMSQLPRESRHPHYQLPDNYVKFFIFGDADSTLRIPDHIRIFNKVGWAYGFLTDVAYIADFEQGIEFMVAATIHVNANETYNDGVYEYDTIGLPFLAAVGRALYDYERQRPRRQRPDLSKLRRALKP